MDQDTLDVKRTKTEETTIVRDADGKEREILVPRVMVDKAKIEKERLEEQER
jgi:hypothetical protein